MADPKYCTCEACERRKRQGNCDHCLCIPPMETAMIGVVSDACEECEKRMRMECCKCSYREVVADGSSTFPFVRSGTGGVISDEEWTKRTVGTLAEYR